MSFVSRHRCQTMNYLFLTGFKYGKLVSMRPYSVESEFITASLTYQDRMRFNIDHLQRFLENTTLKAMQWINLKGHQLTIKTIRP